MKTTAKTFFNRHTFPIFAIASRAVRQGVVEAHRISCARLNRAEPLAMSGAKFDAEDGRRKSVRRYHLPSRPSSPAPRLLPHWSEQKSKGEPKALARRSPKAKAANRNTRPLTQNLSTCIFNDLHFSNRNKNTMSKDAFHFATQSGGNLGPKTPGPPTARIALDGSGAFPYIRDYRRDGAPKRNSEPRDAILLSRLRLYLPLLVYGGAGGRNARGADELKSTPSRRKFRETGREPEKGTRPFFLTGSARDRTRP